MHKELFGENYQAKVRKILSADDKLLPDRIIDADLNVNGAIILLSPVAEQLDVTGATVEDKDKLSKMHEIACHYLAGIICMALKSRTSVAPYDLPKYRKNWDKKRKKCLERAEALSKGIL